MNNLNIESQKDRKDIALALIGNTQITSIDDAVAMLDIVSAYVFFGYAGKYMNLFVTDPDKFKKIEALAKYVGEGPFYDMPSEKLDKIYKELIHTTELIECACKALDAKKKKLTELRGSNQIASKALNDIDARSKELGLDIGIWEEAERICKQELNK